MGGFLVLLHSGWLLIDSITVNGKLIANGDFKQTYTGQYGKIIPKKFTLDPGSKVLYIPDGGKEKTPAVKVNHDHRLFFNLPVEAGKSYELSFTVKAAPAK